MDELWAINIRSSVCLFSLKQAFSSYVSDSLVHHNGYGFIQYATEKEARRAVDAESGLEIHGRRISMFVFAVNSI